MTRGEAHARRITGAFVLLLTTTLSLATDLPAGIEVVAIEHKVLSGPDKDGDLRISVKVTLRNATERNIPVDITLRALDAEEFVVFDAPLSATVKANGTRTLSDWAFVPQNVYKSIVKWELQE